MSVLDRVMENVQVYRAWQAPFAAQKIAPVLRHNDLDRVRTVLDVGCGPGTNAAHFRRARYLGLDWNPKYIDYARQRYPGEFAVADVRTEQITEGRQFECILVNSLFHHISDEDSTALLRKLARLLTPGGHLHVVDMVLPSNGGIARYLATHDRGEHPRPRDVWERMLRATLDPVVIAPYAVGAFGFPLWHMLYFKGRVRS